MAIFSLALAEGLATNLLAGAALGGGALLGIKAVNKLGDLYDSTYLPTEAGREREAAAKAKAKAAVEERQAQLAAAHAANLAQVELVAELKALRNHFAPAQPAPAPQDQLGELKKALEEVKAAKTAPATDPRVDGILAAIEGLKAAKTAPATDPRVDGILAAIEGLKAAKAAPSALETRVSALETGLRNTQAGVEALRLEVSVGQQAIMAKLGEISGKPAPTPTQADNAGRPAPAGVDLAAALAQANAQPNA